MLSRRCFFVTVTFLAVGAAVAPAIPAAASVNPVVVISQLGTKALEMLRPSVPPAQRTAGFRQLFRDNFDIDAIARFVLGPYWHVATPGQRRQFVALLSDYIAGVYAQKLADYGGGSLQVTGTRADGPDGATVTTDAYKPEGGPPIVIEWRLIRVDGQFKISDVIVNNISMATTERAEFSSVIERNGGQVDALLAMLRQKTAEIGSGE